jgi:hypothetical protein
MSSHLSRIAFGLAPAAAPAFAHETYGWCDVTPDRAGRVGLSPHAMGFDGARSRGVLSGGLAENDALLGDAWEWDGLACARVLEPVMMNRT